MRGSARVADGDCLIGRDEDADLVIDHGQVSRRHAMVSADDDGHSIVDLGSTNGTRLNGRPLHGREPLEPGDVIELGEGVELRYEQAGAGLAPWLVAGLVSVAALAAALLLLRGGDGPAWGEALARAEGALGALRSGDAAARAELDAAVRILRESGELDDVARLHAREVGLERLGERLGVDLLALDAGAAEAARRRRHAASSTRPPNASLCRLDGIGPGDFDVCVRERAEGILDSLWQDPRRIPESFYAAVNAQLRFLATDRRAWLEGALARGLGHRGLMERELEAAKVPTTLRYLSLIESGYQTDVQSRAGARGLWQFMPQTARAYGLRVGEGVDERTDPEKSTRAAARYLRDLAFEFGDEALLLAIASYNKGENGIRRALKKLDDPRTDRSYWTLVERGLLPQETEEYVPRLIAAAVLGEAGLPARETVEASRR